MRLEDFPDETCGWCGNSFDGWHPGQKYCCYECRRQSRAAFLKTVWHEEHRRDCEGRTCKHCGTRFDAKFRTKVYCSPRCSGDAWIERNLIPGRRKRMAARAGRKCKLCRKTFDALRDSQQHCSTTCREQDRRLAGRTRVTACVECGKRIPKGRRIDATTCTLRCQKRNWNARNLVKKTRQATCVVCQKRFEAWTKTMLTCSRRCQRDRINEQARERRHQAKARTFFCEAAE